MSNKNINKFLAFTAIAGAAVAAGIAYFKHKNSDLYDDDLDDLEDDFDDEDFDFPLPTENNSNTTKREYVSLNRDADSAKVEDDSTLETASVTDDSVDTKTDEATSENVTE